MGFHCIKISSKGSLMDVEAVLAHMLPCTKHYLVCTLTDVPVQTVVMSTTTLFREVQLISVQVFA